MPKFVEFERKFFTSELLKSQRVSFNIANIGAVFEFKDHVHGNSYAGITLMDDEEMIFVKASYDDVMAKIQEALKDV